MSRDPAADLEDDDKRRNPAFVLATTGEAYIKVSANEARNHMVEVEACAKVMKAQLATRLRGMPLDRILDVLDVARRA